MSCLKRKFVKGLRQRTIACEIQPMLCGTAFKNKGVQRMLDAVVQFLPAPTDIPPVEGFDLDDKPVTREASDDAPFSSLAFKIMTDRMWASSRSFVCIPACSIPAIPF